MPDRLFHVEDDWYEWRQRPPLTAEVRVRVAARDDGRLGLAELRIVGEPTSELLRSIPVGRIEAAANAQLTTLDDNLVVTPRRRRRGASGSAARPGGGSGWEQPAVAPDAGRTRGRPDRFYAGIAAAYLDLASTSRRPAVDLSHEHDVPVTTVHRWIKEARRRGHLAPGRPGKAG